MVSFHVCNRFEIFRIALNATHYQVRPSATFFIVFVIDSFFRVIWVAWTNGFCLSVIAKIKPQYHKITLIISNLRLDNCLRQLCHARMLLSGI